MSLVCRIELLGGLRLVVDGRAVERFRTRKAALLLAYLALHRDRPQPRDLLVELLWPESAPDRGRHSLNVALSSLRELLEPAGAARGSVIATDRDTICLRAAACTTDVARFEAALAAAEAAGEEGERARLLEEALSIYGGSLLPGFEEPWVVAERRRLEEAARAARERLALRSPPAAARPSSGFVGREAELARLRALFAEGVRLITLTGPGGSGKTRLAREAAERLVPAPGVRVAWTPLAAVTDPRLLGDALLQALEAPPDGSKEPLERVAAILAGHPALLILDNYEQLLAGPPEEAAAARDFARELLARAPSATCLVTSRRRLDLEEETELFVPPLPVPDEAGPGAAGRAPGQGDLHAEPGARHPERLTAFPAVRLFVDRTRRVRPEFQLTAENAPAVAGICRRLEGLPLALELAAARATALAPAQILAHLEQPLDLLETRQRDAESRHRSLRATLEWSLRLLVDEEQALFARLSVFRGGWTEEAAAAICSGAGNLAALARSSLVLRDETATGPRYRFLEPIREFAAEQLAARGETEALQRRHAGQFAALAEVCDPFRNLGRQVEAMARLDPEEENLRAALAASVAAPEMSEIALRLCAFLEHYWALRGRAREGLEWCRAALSAEDGRAPASLRARVLNAAGVLANTTGIPEAALGFMSEALQISRQTRDREREAWCLHALAVVHCDLSDSAEAERLAEASLGLFRSLGRPLGAAWALGRLGYILAHPDRDIARARALCEESAAIAREIGDVTSLPLTLDALARLARARGDLEEARRHYEALAALGWGLSYTPPVLAIENLARLRFDTGDLEGAWAGFEIALDLYRRIGRRWQVGAVLALMGDLAFRRGDAGEARRRHEESLAIRRQVRFPGGILWSLAMLATLARQRGDVTEAQVHEEEARRVWSELEPRWQRAFLDACSGWRREVVDAALGEADPDGDTEGSPGGPKNARI